MKKQHLIFSTITIFLLLACGKSDLPFMINQSEVKLHYEDTFIFSIRNTKDVEWSSSDPFVGTIGKDGKFEAHHIGETTITGKTQGQAVTAEVIVEPIVTEVVEPYMQFEKRKADVKKFEKRQLNNETPTVLFYTETSTYTWGANYLFKDNLFTSVSLLWNDARIEEGATFYAERYQLINERDDVHYFMDKSNRIAVELKNDRSLGYIATYTKNTAIK